MVYSVLILEGTPTVPNNTYKAVRLLSTDYNFYYSVWCNNEHELYDLSVSPPIPRQRTIQLTRIQTDPYQVNNLWKSNPNQTMLHGYTMSDVVVRLDALLLVLKSCKGAECIKPWNTLHPDGAVTSLKDALSPQYDQFYHSQPKVSFERCVFGYEIGVEGPQEALAFKNGYSLDAWV